MAFKYLLVSGGLHCIVDEAEHRVVDIYTDEIKAYEVLGELNAHKATAAPVAAAPVGSHAPQRSGVLSQQEIDDIQADIKANKKSR